MMFLAPKDISFSLQWRFEIKQIAWKVLVSLIELKGFAKPIIQNQQQMSPQSTVSYV